MTQDVVEGVVEARAASHGPLLGDVGSAAFAITDGLVRLLALLAALPSVQEAWAGDLASNPTRSRAACRQSPPLTVLSWEAARLDS